MNSANDIIECVNTWPGAAVNVVLIVAVAAVVIAMVRN